MTSLYHLSHKLIALFKHHSKNNSLGFCALTQLAD